MGLEQLGIKTGPLHNWKWVVGPEQSEVPIGYVPWEAGEPDDLEDQENFEEDVAAFNVTTSRYHDRSGSEADVHPLCHFPSEKHLPL